LENREGGKGKTAKGAAAGCGRTKKVRDAVRCEEETRREKEEKVQFATPKNRRKEERKGPEKVLGSKLG